MPYAGSDSKMNGNLISRPSIKLAAFAACGLVCWQTPAISQSFAASSGPSNPVNIIVVTTGPTTTQPTTETTTTQTTTTVTPPPTITPNPGSVTSSIQNLADQRTSQMITNRILASVLLGVNEQVNCSNCVSAFGSAGSFSAGVHGRKKLTDNLSLMGGVAYSEFSEHGYTVTSAPIGAFALRYDFVDWGKSRPFFDVGGVISPSQRVSYQRSYTSSLGAAQIASTATDSTRSSDYAVFERAGWVFRASPRDEIAVSGELWQGWQHVSGYQEAPDPTNPFNTAVAGGTDRMNLVKAGAQWTHLFGSLIEVNVNGGFVQSFSSSSGINATVTGVGTVVPTSGNQHWGEYGARIGYRLTKQMITDLFIDGTVGPNPVGNTIHGGVGLRFSF
jgi:hypothetical protein